MQTVHRHGIYCILPPYILDRILRHGSTSQRNAAADTISNDGTFRALRTATGATLATGASRRRVLTSATPGPQRTIYTAGGSESLPGSVLRAEGGPASADPAVDEAYDGLGHTWTFYHEVFDRNSIDDEGLPLLATVHYGANYDNAFWNGQQMVFGDGDGQLFNRFTISLDVIGHELTHGVTADEAGLIYAYQPGALNEHLSDVFGSLIKQRALGQDAASADWLIGQGLLAKTVHGIALRSMKAPGTAFDDPLLGKDPQPDHMRKYVQTNRDNGGVHINSGIPNKAFHLAATAIGGRAWEKAGAIWYETVRDPRLRANTGFRRFATLTVDQAGRKYGAGGSEQKAVRDAWAQVGIAVA